MDGRGGEPLLMGLDFFQRAVEWQARYRCPGMRVINALQTNGTLLSDEWCQFFRKHNFLVGLSLDGPKALHDAYRRDKGDAPTFDRVMRGLALLKTHNVEYNILTTVHAANGRLSIYGADEGDTLRAASMDGGLAGSVTVGTEMSLTLTLSPVGGLAVQTVGGIPHMRLIAEPSDPGQIDLLVFLQDFGPGADPSVIVTEPGNKAGYAPTLSYSPGSDMYEGEINFSATERGMGHIRAMGAVGGNLVRLQSTYRLQRVINNQGHDVYSNDGNLSLHLEPGSLPGEEAYLVVMPPGAVPGSLPDGLLLVGDPYDVTVSGALVALEKPAVLKLHYDGALVASSSAPGGSGIYRWDPNGETWQEIGGSLDEEQKAIAASVTTLGTYALLAPPGPWNKPLQDVIFVPVVLKDES